jgi:hypothetical protein
VHSAPAAVSKYAIVLATLDGDPGVRLGWYIFVTGEAAWFEIVDGLRQYRRMPSFYCTRAQRRHARLIGCSLYADDNGR